MTQGGIYKKMYLESAKHLPILSRIFNLVISLSGHSSLSNVSVTDYQHSHHSKTWLLLLYIGKKKKKWPIEFFLFFPCINCHLGSINLKQVFYVAVD